MKLVVAGAAGRMGQALIRLIDASEGVTLHKALARAGSPFVGKDAGEIAGLARNGIVIGDDPSDALVDADGMLDFTSPATSVELAAFAAEARIVHVIGTTGCSAEDDAKIEAASRGARIVKSGNMSLGVTLLGALVRQAAAALAASDWDIEVLEMHHARKIDAPSGTALLLGEEAAKGRGVALTANAVRARDGHTGPRKQGAIGFATLRGGGAIGEHSVIFAGESEMVTLSHRASDRSLFAHGALTAARWARDKQPGLYSMLDVLGLSSR